MDWSNDKLFTYFSDRRIKENIQSNVPGLSFITKLNPVTYNVNIHKQSEICGINDTNEWEGGNSGEIDPFFSVQIERKSPLLGDLGGLLFQNNPNPFNQATVIRYALSAVHNSGVVVIRELSGNLVKSITINNTGKGQVTVNANEFATGTYPYSLEIAGESIDTKLMVITK